MIPLNNRFTESSALGLLRENRIRTDGKTILKESKSLGLGALSAVDFLTGYCGYVVI